jgi:hypothetical protein
MCKQQGHKFCAELGADSALWSKHAPLPKPGWIDDAFLVLSQALKLILDDKAVEAKFLLKNSRDLEMREWFDVHAQNSGGWRNMVLGISAPDPIHPLDPVKTFAKFEPAVFARDKLKCRYCSSSLFPKKEFKKANIVLGDEALPLGKTNATRSGFYLMFVATLDHVLPWSLGGRTDESNLVTCCWSCNYGKANFTVEQLGIGNPLGVGTDLN